MAEYIERVVAIAALTEFRDDQTVSKYATVRHCLVARRAIEGAIKVLESLPADDVEPVVRCRECKHRYSDSWCEYVDDDDNFYCARGERKDGDGNG